MWYTRLRYPYAFLSLSAFMSYSELQNAVSLEALQVTEAPTLLNAPPNDEVFDDNPCLSCGACCAHFRVSFYSGEIAGPTGGTVPAELVTQVAPLRACMQGTEQGGRCIALRGNVGQDGIQCSIYSQRPSPCRDFPVWYPDGSPNPDCQRLRHAHGLAVLEHRQVRPIPQLPDCDRAA